MSYFPAKAGDLLFYDHSLGLPQRLIQFGEELEDGDHKIVPYHIAIAVSPFEKIEANGKRTEKVPIDYDLHPLIVRPPYDPLLLPLALAWLREEVGKLYGWAGVIDQALRDATRGHLHLPDGLVRWADNRWPFCSTLAGEFANRAGFDIPSWPPPDPMREWLATKQYLVRHWRHV